MAEVPPDHVFPSQPPTLSPASGLASLLAPPEPKLVLIFRGCAEWCEGKASGQQVPLFAQLSQVTLAPGTL